MSPLPFPAVLSRARRPGFALIIALVLMGLLLLLTVSLTSLVKTDIQSSGISENQQLARQNALLGLKVALAELQNTAGTDQRVTARADITLEGPATPGDPSFAEIANPYWTGVWQSTPPSNHTALEPVAPIGAAAAANNGSGNLSPSSAQLVNWLVSGNENKNEATGIPVTHKPDTDLSGNADFGQNPGSSAVYLLGASTLIGKGASEADSVGLKGAVIAPKVAVRGNDASSKRGHYAWWVGDEGVKARIQSQQRPAIIGKSNDESDHLAFQLPVATNPEVITELETFFNRTNPDIKDIDDFDSLLFAASADDAERLALSGHWHSLSPYSRGLLTDTRWGGLRGDLTLAFENNAIFQKYFGNWNSNDERFYFVALDEFNDYSAKFPNWSNLRSFYNQKNRAGIGNGAVSAQMASPLQGNSAAVYAQEDTRPYKNDGADQKEGYHADSPVHPLLSRMQVSVGVRYVALPGEVEPNPPIGQPARQLYAPVLVIKPLVGLYNPYNVTLEAPVDGSGNGAFYEPALSFSPRITMKVQNKNDSTLPPELIDDGVQFYLREVLNSTNYASANPGDNPSQALHMQLPRVAIQPGETRMFGLWQNDVLRNDYEQASGTAGINRLALTTAQNESTAYDHADGFLLLPLNDSWEAGTIEAFSGLPIVGENRLGLHPDEKRYLKVTEDDIIEITIEAVQPGEAWLAASAAVDGVNASDNNIQYFGPIGSEGLLTESKNYDAGVNNANDKILEWGFWLRGVNDQATASRLLVDHNIRALTGGQNWDQMNNNFYLTSIYTGEFEGNQDRGYINTDISSSILANAAASERFTGFWGGSTSGADGGVDRVVLFDVPRSALISLGALQHANIGRYPTDPTYVIGNSFPPARLGDLQRIHDTGYMGNNTELWDLSYLINQQLWDSYYFSGIPATISAAEITSLGNGTRQLPNHRLSLFARDGSPAPSDLTTTSSNGDTFYDVASWLIVEGAFNVNSTSEEAWAALLSSSQGLRIPVYDLQGNNAGGSMSFQNENDVVFSRLLNPIDGKTTGQSGNTFWRGYRTLTQTEVKDLAAAIVKQIRAREKPFASLAEFVNRPLESSSAGNPARAGLLQEAINEAGLNANAPGGTLSGASLPSGLAANNDIINDTEAAVAFPGAITQADILQALGPVLSARSDTFTIRSYGDVVNPANGTVESQAWCEAVVQRVPHETLGNANHLSRSANRKFRVISFRWLTKDEI